MENEEGERVSRTSLVDDLVKEIDSLISAGRSTEARILARSALREHPEENQILRRVLVLTPGIPFSVIGVPIDKGRDPIVLRSCLENTENTGATYSFGFSSPILQWIWTKGSPWKGLVVALQRGEIIGSDDSWQPMLALAGSRCSEEHPVLVLRVFEEDGPPGPG